jgi:hypothetical protein
MEEAKKSRKKYNIKNPANSPYLVIIFYPSMIILLTFIIRIYPQHYQTWLTLPLPEINWREVVGFDPVYLKKAALHGLVLREAITTKSLEMWPQSKNLLVLDIYLPVNQGYCRWIPSWVHKHMITKHRKRVKRCWWWKNEILSELWYK